MFTESCSKVKDLWPNKKQTIVLVRTSIYSIHYYFLTLGESTSLKFVLFSSDDSLQYIPCIQLSFYFNNTIKVLIKQLSYVKLS